MKYLPFYKCVFLMNDYSVLNIILSVLRKILPPSMSVFFKFSENKNIIIILFNEIKRNTDIFRCISTITLMNFEKECTQDNFIQPRQLDYSNKEYIYIYIVCFIKYQLDSAAIELMLAMFCIKTRSGTMNKLCICKDIV